MPLIAGALAAIVVAGIVYLHPSVPTAHSVLRAAPSPTPPPLVSEQYQVAYDFLTSTAGWALVADQGSALPKFWVFKTTDKAKHWQIQLTGTIPSHSGGLVKVQFFDASTGIVVLGGGGAIYRTRDGGVHWTALPVPAFSFATVDFSDSSHGWILGTIAGVIVGFGIGLSTLARGVGITFISALFPIPKIALLPLLILWLGIGEEPKIATIALGVFFSTAISVYSGVDSVPRNLIRMAQSFNVPFHGIVRRVIWPGALPSILAGFRITASVALLLVVSAEMIGAEFGIGAFVLQAGNLMQTDQLLAGVVILSLFGLAVGRLINWLETRLLHWR